MAKADLTAARVRDLLEYDPFHGTWQWRVDRPGGVKAGDSAGCISRGYIVIGIDAKVYVSHRLAWLYMTGNWPTHHIDHIDGNPSNNAFINLRDVPRTINLQNRHRADKDSRTKLLGVTQLGSFWKSEICFNGQRRHLGTFDTKELAYAAYLAAKRDLHPEAPISESAADAPPKNGHRPGRSGLSGVRLVGVRWAAHVYVSGAQKHIGMFDSKECAYQAHLAAKAALLGHAGERMGDLYADPRGVESIRVKVDDGNLK